MDLKTLERLAQEDIGKDSTIRLEETRTYVVMVFIDDNYVCTIANRSLLKLSDFGVVLAEVGAIKTVMKYMYLVYE